MKQNEALELLKYYQEWRLGGDGKQPEPKDITRAIDVAIRVLSKQPEPVFMTGKTYEPWGK